MNITTCSIDEGTPCGVPDTESRLSVPVCGIAAEECFGFVSLVAVECCVLIDFRPKRFHSVLLNQRNPRGPPVRVNISHTTNEGPGRYAPVLLASVNSTGCQ